MKRSHTTALFTAAAVALLLAACSANRPWVHKDLRGWDATQPPGGAPAYSFFLLGDAGKATDNDPVMRTLRYHALQAGGNSTTLLMGDNIYDVGLPPADDPGYAEARDHLLAQLHALKGYPGNIYAFGGNHDWDQSGPDGWNAVQRQEQFLETYLAQNAQPSLLATPPKIANPDPKALNYGGVNAFLPDNGCPGPLAVELGKDWVMLVIDTQWWLHPHDKPTTQCPNATPEAVIEDLSALLIQYHNRKVLVVGHHPLVSNAAHGLHYTWTEHLFPLRMISKKLWIPLPVLGTLLVWGRIAAKHNTDMSNPQYKKLIAALGNTLAQHPKVVYASGHDHTLQLHPFATKYQQKIAKYKGQDIKTLPHIVSGAGSKASPVRTGLGAQFAYAHKGFTVLRQYTNGQVWVEFICPDPATAAEPGAEPKPGVVVFRTRLY